MILDKTSKLLATLSPKNATNKEVTWQSSDVSVATVDADGNVTAVGGAGFILNGGMDQP